MGLQSQLSDVSSESILILTAVLIGKIVRYVHSLLFALLHHLGLFQADHHQHHSGSSLYDDVGSGLGSLVVLCDQLNLNRACSYQNQSDGDDGNLDTDCVVCLDQLEEGDCVRRLPCRHVFHKDCLDGWLDRLNFNCPLCRAPLAADELVDCTGRRVAEDLLAWFPFQ